MGSALAVKYSIAIPNELCQFFGWGILRSPLIQLRHSEAVTYAPAFKHPPIQYGAYTFFVGTIGLWELLKPR